MSTPDGSVPTRGMHPAAKWALGFGIGCAVLVLLCCGACGLGWFKAIVPFGEKMEQAGRDQQAAAEVQRQIEALDTEFPPTLPEAVAEAMVTEDQLARYARIRTALAEPLARVSAVTSKALPAAPTKPSGVDMLRTVAGLVSAKMGASAEWLTCVEAALPLLRQEGMGPTDLARLTEIVEWRYLRRPEARSLGLSAAERAEMESLTVEAHFLERFSPENMPAGMKIEGRDAEQMRSRIALVKTRLEELRTKADLDVALSGPTLAVLDVHRGELEALPAEGVALLAGLTQPSPMIDALDTMGRGASWEGHASTGQAEEQPPTEAPAPEGSSAP